EQQKLEYTKKLLKKNELDMGQPMKIYDLAVQMIELLGYSLRDEEHPHGDIEIVIDGLRPGEKLFEELSTTGELKNTSHPKIQLSVENGINPEEVLKQTDQLESILSCREDTEAIQLLCSMVPEYVAQINTPETVIIDITTKPEGLVTN
ncbi:MAG: polysaccharide biosynthesis protein, partial [Planctomycetes bacterium]|nr:polysaccharide biosynthesis protein [Planctomycetota bacterium]